MIYCLLFFVLSLLIHLLRLFKPLVKYDWNILFDIFNFFFASVDTFLTHFFYPEDCNFFYIQTNSIPSIYLIHSTVLVLLFYFFYSISSVNLLPSTFPCYHHLFWMIVLWPTFMVTHAHTLTASKTLLLLPISYWL